MVKILLNSSTVPLCACYPLYYKFFTPLKWETRNNNKEYILFVEFFRSKDRDRKTTIYSNQKRTLIKLSIGDNI